MADKADRERWRTDPDAALTEARRRLAEEVEDGRLSLTGLAALTRLPPGLADRRDVTALNLAGTGIADLSGLRPLTWLRSLNLRSTPVSDLAPLAGLTALGRLSLDRTQVSDLAPLAGLTALQWLSLDRTQVSDLAPLAGLTALQTLWLTGTQVADLAPLAGLTALGRLGLTGTPVSDLAPLAGLTALQTLWLNGTPVSDLAPLAGLTALQTLRLGGTPVSDLAPLAGLAALQRLTLKGTQVSDLAPLAGLTALQMLTLDGTQVADLAPLAGLARLREAAEESGPISGLSFKRTPAADRDEAHRHLAGLEGRPCAIETLQYLNGEHPTLGGPPAPWRPAPSPRPPLPDPFDFAEQNPAGLQYQISGALLTLDTRATPTARAEKLLPQLQGALEDLDGVFDRPNSRKAIRIKEDAARMNGILGRGMAAVADEAVVLWALSVALGHRLQQDKRALAEGRDPLDRLTSDQAEALDLLVSIAAAFVRLLPETSGMDDARGDFLRTAYDAERTIEMVVQAVSARVLEQVSGELIAALARIAAEQGDHADKARAVTVIGERTFWSIVAHYARQAAVLAGAGTLAATTYVAQGALGEVGADMADEWWLSLNSAYLVRDQGQTLREMLPDLPPDVAASLRSAIEAVESVELPPLPLPRPAAPAVSPTPSERPAAPGSAPAPSRPKR